MARRALAVVCTATFALGAAACGGDGDGSSGNPREVILDAASKTVDAGAARLTMSISQGGFDITGEGVVDNKSEKADLKLKLPSGVGGDMRVLRNGDVFYLQFPASFGVRMPEGKSWIRLDLDALAEQGGQALAGLEAFRENSDPTGALNYLRGVSDDITEVGRETLRGTRTTQYRMTLDLAKAAREASGDAERAVKRMAEQLGNQRIPSDVWIDGEGRLRKMTQIIDMSKAEGAAQQGKVETTFELFDFGVDLDVEPPPDNQVAEYDEISPGSS